ncbi:hypothetical protein M5D96_011514, partial [Drosophila gunungcola]
MHAANEQQTSRHLSRVAAPLHFHLRSCGAMLSVNRGAEAGSKTTYDETHGNQPMVTRVTAIIHCSDSSVYLLLRRIFFE